MNKTFISRDVTSNISMTTNTDSLMLVTSSNQDMIHPQVREFVIDKSNLHDDEVLHFELTIKPVVRKIPYLVDIEGTDIVEGVRQALTELEGDIDSLSNEDNFREIFDFDSLDGVELEMAIEEEFETKIEYGELEGFLTVNDIAQKMKELL